MIKEQDKLYHFIGGAITTLVVGALSFIWLGLLAGIFVAVGKEVYDYFHPEGHTVDGMDFIATMVGVLTAMEAVRCFGLQ